MKCSCGNVFTASPTNYVGTQLFPHAVLALFNCEICHSTRGVCIAEVDDEEEREPESVPLAAE